LRSSWNYRQLLKRDHTASAPLSGSGGRIEYQGEGWDSRGLACPGFSGAQGHVPGSDRRRGAVSVEKPSSPQGAWRGKGCCAGCGAGLGRNSFVFRTDEAVSVEKMSKATIDTMPRSITRSCWINLREYIADSRLLSLL